MKSWLQDNDIEIHSTYNERKSAVAQRFIRTLKNKIYKHMTSISKNVYIDKLDDLVNKHDHTIKMKSIDVKLSTFIDFCVKSDEKDPKLKVCDHVRISHNNVFTKGYIPNWFLQNFCY